MGAAFASASASGHAQPYGTISSAARLPASLDASPKLPQAAVVFPSLADGVQRLVAPAASVTAPGLPYGPGRPAPGGSSPETAASGRQGPGPLSPPVPHAARRRFPAPPTTASSFADRVATTSPGRIRVARAGSASPEPAAAGGICPAVRAQACAPTCRAVPESSGRPRLPSLWPPAVCAPACNQTTRNRRVAAA